MASILVVEDDTSLREALCRALRGAGHTVEVAGDGARALRSLRGEQPELLVTDLMMPDGDGIELITAVKKDYPAVRILAISGRGFLGAVNLLNLAAMLGADATLPKPLVPEDLLETVAALTASA
jgi:CheY-like chemotaxis protein